MRYTMQELLDSAKAQHFSPKARLVQEWVDLGLLDRPERRGRGRGQGVSATWSDEQRGLFLSLLSDRQTVTRLVYLCNRPVGAWLYFGDRYAPLRQARRSLSTWCGKTSSPSWQATRRIVRELLDVHMAGRRKETEALLDEVAGQLYRTPRQFTADDEAALLSRLHQLLDPTQTGLVRTLDGVALEPEAYVEVLKARTRAVAAITDDTVDDALFHWARYSELQSRAGYQRHLSALNAGGASGLTIPTIQEISARSCLTLVTLLGLGLDVPDTPPTGSLAQPATWREQNLRTTVRGEIIGTSVQIMVEVKPAAEPGGGPAEP